MFLKRGVHIIFIFILAIIVPELCLNLKDTEFIILYNGIGQFNSGSALNRSCNNSSKVLGRQSLLRSQETGIPVFNLHAGESKSRILEDKGFKMGVIGPHNPNNTGKYENCIDFIKSEAEKLKAQGTNIIISLGHLDYQIDQDVAKLCPEVVLFLRPETITVVQNSNQKFPSVKTYFCPKCLAKIQVKFDTFGNLKDFKAEPNILELRQEKQLDFVEQHRFRREGNASSPASSKLLLKGDACQEEECLLGNFLTDAMVYARMLEDKAGMYWTDASIALLHAGAIQGSISSGAISDDTINSVLPEVEDLMVIQISGKNLWATLEYSAEARLKSETGGFLQVSGLIVECNFRGPRTSRVEFVGALCTKCEVPAFAPLRQSAIYSVIVPSSLLKGGGGHDLGQYNISKPKKMRWNNRKAVMEYVKRCNTIYPEIEGRISDKNRESGQASGMVVSINIIVLSYLLTKLC